jgi:hypothetical protein
VKPLNPRLCSNLSEQPPDIMNVETGPFSVGKSAGETERFRFSKKVRTL